MGDREGVVLPRSEGCERGEIYISMVPWVWVPPQTHNVYPYDVRGDLCHGCFPNAIFTDPQDSDKAVKEPNRADSVEPVLVDPREPFPVHYMVPTPGDREHREEDVEYEEHFI